MRTADVAVKNWTANSQNASALYVSQAQLAQWKAPASSDSAEANYATGIQKAVAGKTRQAAIIQSSDATWQAGVASTGAQRYGPGVVAAAPKMSAAMSKLLPAIQAARTALPARGVRGSAANTQRSTLFQQALAAKRGTFKASGVAKATS